MPRAMPQSGSSLVHGAKQKHAADAAGDDFGRGTSAGGGERAEAIATYSEVVSLIADDLAWGPCGPRRR